MKELRDLMANVDRALGDERATVGTVDDALRPLRAAIASMASGDDDYPKPCSKPEPNEMVQVLMTEHMARRFEARCLGSRHTVGETHLVGPLIFSEDDSTPTYIIGVGE